MEGRIVGFFKKHVIISMVVSGLLGGIIGWGINWILPSKAVQADNIPKKELTCILNYTQKLITKNANDNMLKIIYNNVEVTDPYITSITITNTGAYEISNEDFKKVFSIDFAGCDYIVSARIVKSSNKSVLEEILSKSKFEGTEMVISDFFLNPNETFTVNVITDKKPNTITYSPRISGVANLTLINTTAEKIEKLKSQRNTIITIMLVSVSLGVIVIIVYLIVDKIRWNKYKRKILLLEEDKNNG